MDNKKASQSRLASMISLMRRAGFGFNRCNRSARMRTVICLRPSVAPDLRPEPARLPPLMRSLLRGGVPEFPYLDPFITCLRLKRYGRFGDHPGLFSAGPQLTLPSENPVTSIGIRRFINVEFFSHTFILRQVY